MPCNHRFKSDLNIKYSKSWNPEILIVGTFNPAWSDNNASEWFYGRLENNFWNVLPRLYNSKKSLQCKGKLEWMKFCEEHKIAITDLIECINAAEYDKHRTIISGFSDKAIEDNFKNEGDLKLVDIKNILEENSSIKYVYLTRGATQGLWKKLWKPIKEYCNKHNLECKELLTPSNYAFYQYTKEQREKYSDLSTFILSRWKEKWHSISP